jgi:hypothetical protein
MQYATSEQLGNIEDLLSTNQLYTGRYDRLWAELEAARIDERERGDGSPMSAQRATEIWTWLNRARQNKTLRNWV